MKRQPTLDPQQVKHIASCELPGSLFALCYDHAGGKLYGAGTDWAVYCVDVRAEKPTAEKKWAHHDNYVSALVWLEGMIVSGGFDRRLIWSVAETGEPRRVIANAHDGWVREVVASPDGKRLVSVGDDMLVKVWDAQTGELLHALNAHARKTPQGFATALYTVAVSPDGRTLASADRIGHVCVWDAENGKLIRRLEAATFYTYDAVKRSRSLGGIRSVCFSPDGTQIAIAGIGVVTNVDGFVGPCRVEVWDWHAGQHLFTGQDDHKAVLNQVAFHPSEPWLIAGGGGDSGGVLAFWDQRSDQPPHKVKHEGHVQRFVLDSPAQRLFTAGYGGFQIWA